VQRLLARQLRDHVATLDTLLARDVPTLNELLKQRNLPNVVPPPRAVAAISE
jgi:hypothetical protein